MTTKRVLVLMCNATTPPSLLTDELAKDARSFSDRIYSAFHSHKTFASDFHLLTDINLFFVIILVVIADFLFNTY